MSYPIQLLLCSLSLLAAISGSGYAQESSSPSYYLIGNSLTWDTVPSQLAGDVQWHVDCGVSLPYIYTNPAEPCVEASTIWPEALRDKRYDFVSVQPHYDSNLAEDVEVISAWMQLQPAAVFVLHSGWAFHAERADEFASFTSPDGMVHSPGYLRALIEELRRRRPDRVFRQTFAQNLLACIAEDIAAGQAPLKDVESLYRDAIHLTHDHGRYLAHNAMRRALGQPHSAKGFQKLDPELKQYLDGVLELLDTTPADKARLRQILSIEASTDRAGLIRGITEGGLRNRMLALLPKIEQAAQARREALSVANKIRVVGGRAVWSPSGPQWLYLATGDRGTEIFDVITTVDLYNGNNPLKGRGGRNEQITDEWLKHLSGLSTLKRLDVANCEIHGPGLRHIAGLTGLRELNLTLTPVTDEGLEHLAQLTELRTLGLASTKCNGTGFAHLKALRKLENVNFHFTPLNDAGLRAISQIPISDRLWFAHTRFTDAGAKALASLTELKHCGIGSNHKESSGAAVAALSQLPLEELSLLDSQATPEGIEHAAKISTLERLDVSHAPAVTDQSMMLIAQMPNLTEFRLRGARLTDDGLRYLARSKSLKSITLSGANQITPAVIEELKKSHPGLVIEIR